MNTWASLVSAFTHAYRAGIFLFLHAHVQLSRIYSKVQHNNEWLHLRGSVEPPYHSLLGSETPSYCPAMQSYCCQPSVVERVCSILLLKMTVDVVIFTISQISPASLRSNANLRANTRLPVPKATTKCIIYTLLLSVTRYSNCTYSVRTNSDFRE